VQHDDGPDRAQSMCWFCGEPEKLEIGDLWTDSNFVFNTCCSGLLDSVAEGMNDDPAWGRELLRRLGAEQITGHRLRRVSNGDCCHPMLDWQLTIRPIRFAEAQAFINRYHAHCRAPVVIWTTCISTGTPDSVGVPCGQMERSNGKIRDPARGCHRPLSRQRDRAISGPPRCMQLLAEHCSGVSLRLEAPDSLSCGRGR